MVFRGSIGASARRVLCAACVAATIGAAGAQSAPIGPADASARWSGSFSVAYAWALTGAAAAPASGPLLRADLSFEDGPRRVALVADPLGLRRAGLTLEVREGAELVSLRALRTPLGALGGDVRSDVQALVVARPDGAPTVQALVASQRQSADGGSGSLLAGLAVSDRHARPAPGVASIDWRATLQSVVVDVAATAVRRGTTTVGLGVGGAFGGADDRRYRPSLGATIDLRTGDRPGSRVGVDVGFAFDATDAETVDLRGDAAWDPALAGAATGAALAVRSDRFDPVGLVADLERRMPAAGAPAWRWSVGADARLGGGWTVAGGYRGEADDAGSGHGVRARFAARLGAGGRTLSAGLDGGALWRDDGTFRPELGGTLAARFGEGGPWSGTLGASLRYDDRWVGAVDGAVRAEFPAATLDADVAATLGDAWAADAGVRLAVAAWDPVGVQVGLEGRFGPHPAALALDLGLRYRLGGPR